MIERATPLDLGEILMLFDDVQAWLIGKGLAEQWGTTPFSKSHGQSERFRAWLEEEVFYVLRDEGAIVGTVVINPETPFYALESCNAQPRQALYLEALASHPQQRGRGVGRQLLVWAERVAQEGGVPWLRLDCWDQNEVLKAYYRSAGYAEFATCQLGAWRGALFEKRVL